jgi:hypothetical protein
MMTRYPVRRFDCDICLALPISLTITHPCMGPPAEFPAVVKRLRDAIDNLKCCMQCGTYYRVDHDQDHDHFYPDSYDTLVRLSPIDALQAIGNFEAERDRILAVYDSQIEDLLTLFKNGATNPSRFELSRALCQHYLRASTWSEIDKLLQSESSYEREGALDAISKIDLKTVPGTSLKLIAENPAKGAAWYSSMNSLCQHPEFAYVFEAVLAALDHEKEFVRGYAVVLLKSHMKGATVRTMPSNAKDYIPLLIKHMAFPKKVDFPYHPSSGTTDEGASVVLSWLIPKKDIALLIHEMQRQGV